MAQVLKTSQRNKIIQAAKDNFLAKGIKDTSLRAIAKDSGMTVGNLYRYFPSKKDIVDAVVNPALEMLGSIAKIMGDERDIVLENLNAIVKDEQLLKETMILVADSMVETQQHYRTELLILINDEEVNRRYSDWLIELMNRILHESDLHTLKNEFQYEMLSNMVAKSVFYGLHEGIRLMCTTDAPIEEYRLILRGYMLNSFSKIVRI